MTQTIPVAVVAIAVVLATTNHGTVGVPPEIPIMRVAETAIPLEHDAEADSSANMPLEQTLKVTEVVLRQEPCPEDGWNHFN